VDLFSFHNVLFAIVTQLFIYFPLGYLTIGKRIKNQPFSIRVLISIIFGLPILTIILTIIGFFYIGAINLILITIISYVILIISSVNKKSNRVRLKRIRIINLTKPDFIITFLMVLLIVIFSNITSHMGWAPGVDSINHGMLTSLLINNQKIISTLEPIAPSQPWFEPFGFHINSANISLLMDLFPGQSILLFSTVITILTIISCFVIVYYISKSITLSLIAMVSCFFIFSHVQDIRFLEKWFLGFFYNTPYANLFGFYFLIQFFFVYFVMNDFRRDHQKGYFIGLTVSIIGILLSYTPFLVIPLSYLVIKRIYYLFGQFTISKRIIKRLFSQSFQTIDNQGILKIVNIIIISFSIFFLLSLSNFIVEQFQDSNNNFFTLINRIKNNSYFYSSVVLNPSSFSDLSGYWSISLLILSALSIFRKNRIQISCFYLIVTLILTLSSFTFQFLNELLWFMLGGRLFVFMVLLNGIVTPLYIYDFTKWIVNLKKLQIGKHERSELMFYLHLITSFIVITVAFIPSLISNASLEQATFWGWQVVNMNFQNDYKLLDWISNNINKTDLIMTDYTYTSKKLMSFSLNNVTAIPIPILPEEVQLGKDTVIVWDKPTLLKSYIERYNIKYILLDSDFNHRVPAELGGVDENVPRNYNSSEYKVIFSNMPFLSKIIEYGESTLYKVINLN
jgi:hypothetical protein